MSSLFDFLGNIYTSADSFLASALRIILENYIFCYYASDAH